VNISLCNVSVLSVTSSIASSVFGPGVLSTGAEPPSSVRSNPRHDRLCASKYSGLGIRDGLFDWTLVRALVCSLFCHITDVLWQEQTELAFRNATEVLGKAVQNVRLQQLYKNRDYDVQFVCSSRTPADYDVPTCSSSAAVAHLQTVTCRRAVRLQQSHTCRL
jgi:hypothetical protein